MRSQPITVASILFLVAWFGVLALGLGTLLWWLNGSLLAVMWVRKRRRVLALLPVTPRALSPYMSVEVVNDDTASLLRSATTMYAGLLQDGREMGKRQRIKVAMTGDGLRVAKPAVFDNPDVPFDEVGLFDRGSEHGGEPMARFSRFLVADEWEDGTIHVGEPDPF